LISAKLISQNEIEAFTVFRRSTVTLSLPTQKLLHKVNKKSDILVCMKNRVITSSILKCSKLRNLILKLKTNGNYKAQFILAT